MVLFCIRCIMSMVIWKVRVLIFYCSRCDEELVEGECQSSNNIPDETEPCLVCERCDIVYDYEDFEYRFIDEGRE